MKAYLKKLKRHLYALLIIPQIILIASCSNIGSTSRTIQPYTRDEFVIGTVVQLRIYDSLKPKDAEAILDNCIKILKEIESKMSVNIHNSEVSKINQNAGAKEVQVSEDTFYVIKKGLHYAKISDGLFDISIGPLVKLWGIGTENAHLPSEEEIKRTLSKVGYKNIIVDDQSMTVKLKETGMSIDLGGIAKGYAADKLAKYLKSRNIKSAVINLGGNVYALGNNVNSRPWRIGIQNPFKERNTSVGIVKVSEKTVVTSGIYERYFEEDGKTYHHILDPFTGYPADNDLAGATIICESSTDADALSTAVFVKGKDKAADFIKNLDGVEAVLITKDKKIYITPGIKDDFELVDKEFKLDILR